MRLINVQSEIGSTRITPNLRWGHGSSVPMHVVARH
jgi:hypothetical protein